MKKERIIYLDLIRILGFVFISLYHFTVSLESFGITAHLERYKKIAQIAAPMGLAAFLMVSGAALIYQYREEIKIRSYYKKRFLGIYPLFWLAYLITFLVKFYRVRQVPEIPKINFIFTILGLDGYMSDFIPTFYLVGEWFLGMIVLLYLLFPLYRAIMLKCKYILPVLFLAGSLWIFFDNPFPIFVDKNVIVCSLYFVIGMMIELFRQNTDKKKFDIGRRIAAIVGLILFIFLLNCGKLGFALNYFCNVFVRTLCCYIMIMEMCAWIRGDRIKKMIVRIGNHSYAFFLIHHVFLDRYAMHFAGTVMSGTNTLVLYFSSMLYIYLLAIGLDYLYAYLRKAAASW